MPATHRLSRRHLLVGGGALGAVGMVGAVAGLPGGGETHGDHDASPQLVEFHGPHQAGIATPVQQHLHFAAFDVTANDLAGLVALLQDWTAAARAMTANRPVERVESARRLAPPSDTGETLDLHAARLTITVGLGRSLFDDRFGLADRSPAPLADLPAYPGDVLDPARCGGDLVIQTCSDDPQMTVHAVRNLSRIATGLAAVRWAQLGFGKASATDTAGPTPRNLFGFKDGTANIRGDDADALADHVWAQPSDGSAWMAGGSYLVARRIRMTVESWDRTSLEDQERAVGRTKDVGAPLGAAREHDRVRPHGLPTDSHVRLAHPSLHGGVRMLRRGFSFVDGADELGHLDAGLFFLAYQRDPRRAFVPVQAELSRHDAMSRYVRHTGSSVWAVPPGVGPDGWWGETLLG